jgi:hypothetical protein
MANNQILTRASKHDSVRKNAEPGLLTKED